MDCHVCLEDRIDEKNIHYMECLHYICNDCFGKLLSSSCPFCRQNITLFKNNKDEFIDDYCDSFYNENEIFFENDFIIPTIRKDKRKNKRKKCLNKKLQLENIINQIDSFKNIHSITILNIVPNNNKRSYKKLHNVIFC